ncbi:MAG: hypothetical protein ACE14W_05955 [Candidatus Velamenicoccus archaeovorus]
MVADAVQCIFRCANQFHDLCYVGGLILLFAIPQAVVMVRHRMWRRQVLSAFR